MNYHRNYRDRQTIFPAPAPSVPRGMVDGDPQPYSWFKSNSPNPQGLSSIVRPNGGSLSISKQPKNK